MSDIAITVDGLGKAYRIGLKEEIPDSIMSALGGWMKAPLKNFKNLRSLNTFKETDGEAEDVIWALKDVSFEVKRGEVIGIIGRNGAGKSTLLKILSRITEPTTGRATIRGRVSSLLEVGTGFHPDLTGRENVYMNGTILGMTKREIDRKFDEIVDFSGVEKFLDTPVKRYSSGMKVRLAFAVAAHLEPEILVIDEVLAVGDAEFQKKCLGKMQDVAHSGRTVLFVSHNMAAVTNLCGTGVVLTDGRNAFHGDIEAAVDHYSEKIAESGNVEDSDLDKYRESWCRPYISFARFAETNGAYPPVFPLGGEMTLELGFDAGLDSPVNNPVMGIVVQHLTKGAVGGVNMRMTGFHLERSSYRNGILRCRIPRIPFLQGRYVIDIWLGDGPADIDVLKQYLCFDIEATDYYKTGQPPKSHHGTTILDAEWDFQSA